MRVEHQILVMKALAILLRGPWTDPAKRKNPTKHAEELEEAICELDASSKRD